MLVTAATAGAVGAVGGVGVESERLVAVLERAVGALELLATLPTPETSVSFAAFLLGAHDGDDQHHDHDHDRRSVATPLAREAHDALASHFRLEASLAKQAVERQQRRASVATSTRPSSQRCVSKPPGGDVPAERPEVDEAHGFDEHDDNDDADEAVGGEGDEDQDEEDDDDGWDHDDALRFPRSLHHVVNVLTHDKPARDALRRLSATRISPDAAALVHVLTDLIVLRERAFQTSPEQDEQQQRALRDAAQRFVELHDDAAQLRFELAAEREARQAHALAHVKSISQLREQLAETKRHAAEVLRATLRTRDHDAQALRTQFESDKVGVHERALALARVDGRVADAHQAEEGDDRRRVARAVADLNELLARYDDEMAALDEALELAQDEALDAASDVARLATYFERVDEDRHHQLEEQCAREAEEARRRRRDLNLFKFTTRLQAFVRGFLTRRRVRLEEKLQQQRRRKKTKKGSSKGSPKKTKSKTTKTATKPGGDQTKSSSTSSSRKPSRPASATRTRPASARRGVA